MNEFRNQLVNASKLKQTGKYEQALEVYEKLYRENPDEFKRQQKVDYAWTIIKVKMLESDDEFYDAARQITELLPQVSFIIFSINNERPITTGQCDIRFHLWK